MFGISYGELFLMIGATAALVGANISVESPEVEVKSTASVIKENINFRSLESLNLHTQASAYAKLVESAAVKAGSLKSNEEKESLIDENGLFPVLPISAEGAGMLPKRKENIEGLDIVLEAVVEAEVARNAKDFFYSLKIKYNED